MFRFKSILPFSTVKHCQLVKGFIKISTRTLTISSKTSLTENQYQLKNNQRKQSNNFCDSRILSKVSIFEHVDDEKFHDAFRIIVQHLRKHLISKNMPDVADWLAKSLQYNFQNGDYYVGKFIVLCYKILAENPNDEQMLFANIVGWCQEMIIMYLTIYDDIMDQSETRFGKPCWYKKENVGTMAVNDAVLIQSSTQQLISDYAPNEDVALKILNYFTNSVWTASLGQCLDMLGNHRYVRKYNYEMYDICAKYRSGFTVFCDPLRLALLMAHKSHYYTQPVEELLLNIAHYFQVYNDYEDCFGKDSGKVEGDIKAGKRTWLILKALERANAEERTILETNYGMADEKRIQKVKDVYDKIGIKDLYQTYHKETYLTICKEIEEVAGENDRLKLIFYGIINYFYKPEL